jgi:thymidylate synthase (FAD)
MSEPHLIHVLDQGFVRLVDHMGNDLSIVRAARVSYDADWRVGEDAGKDEKLINYLYKNKHTSPFESVVFTFEVKAPMFVLRQWHRHRMWSYNEISARYCELDEGYYVPNAAQITTQSASNKQMRTKEQHPQAKEIRAAIAKVNEDSYRNYKTLIEAGCPRELARSVLPVGAYSRMFATVDLHNLLHFLRLRSHEHAQWEIQEYARAMESLIQPIVPYTVAAYRKSLESAA